MSLLPLAVLLLGFAALPALAHDALVGSTPASGARVTGASLAGQVVLHFEEPPLVIGAQVRVTGPAGTISTGAPEVRGSDLVQQLTPAIAAGAYTVTWRITSDDGHVVSGTIPFTVTQPATGSSPATPAGRGDPSAPAQAAGAGWPLIGGAVAAVLVVAAALTRLILRRRSGTAR